MKRFFKMFILLIMGGALMAQSSQDNCSNDRAYLGIYTHDVSEEKAELLRFPNPDGSMITEVMVGGAADQANLQPFDYIYGIDDYRTDRNDDLADLLRQYKAGDQAMIHLIRKGEPLAVNVVFGRQSDSRRRQRDEGEQAFLGISKKGSDPGEMGVSVSVIKNSTAKEMGLKSGDKIEAINGYPIVDWADISTAIGMMEVGDQIAVDFKREGTLKKATATIRSHEDTYDYEEDHYENVESAFLGIFSNSISKEKALKLGFENPYGSYVSSVIGNTAAKRAGIQPFDYIYGIDEYRTGRGQSLTHILRKYEVDEQATVHYIRKGKNREVEVTFGSRQEARYLETDRCEEPFLGVQSSHSYSERTGVSINVVRSSTAEALGLENGDLITQINDYPMIDWDDISTAINNMSVGNNITVRWFRDGQEMEGSEAIKSYCETKTNQIVMQDRVREENPDWGRRSDSKEDLSRVKVSVAEINREEANEMSRRYNVDLNLENEVGMKAIRIETHPEKGVFNLSFDLPNRGQTTVRIYNNLGRNIYEYDLGSFSGAFNDEVDLFQNGEGTYYLHVQQGGKSSSMKILVKKV